MNAYKELMYELKDEKPDYIVVPCWSWDIIVGIWLWIQELWLKTKIIWVWPKNEHPLKMALVSWNDENTISTYKDLSVADKLTTSFTAVLPLLYHIFTQSWNLYAEVSNEEIIKTKKHLEELWLKVENSAVTAFATFLSYERPQIDPDSKIIIV
jgi:threonine synthase